MADRKRDLLAALAVTNDALARHDALPDITVDEAKGLTEHALRIVVEASGERLASLIAMGR